MKKFIATLLLASGLFCAEKINAFDYDVDLHVGINVVNMSTDYLPPVILEEMSKPMLPVQAKTFVGFTGGIGVNLDFWNGVGLQTGLDYSRRNIKANWGNLFYNDDLNGGQVSDYNARFIYLELPVMPSWKINIPAVKNIVVPMIYTGPIIGFELEGTVFAGETQKVLVDWRVGAGFKLFKHWKLDTSYSFPLQNTMTFSAKPIEQVGECHAKAGYWKVTLGYCF